MQKLPDTRIHCKVDLSVDTGVVSPLGAEVMSLARRVSPVLVLVLGWLSLQKQLHVAVDLVGRCSSSKVFGESVLQSSRPKLKLMKTPLSMKPWG